MRSTPDDAGADASGAARPVHGGAPVRPRPCRHSSHAQRRPVPAAPLTLRRSLPRTTLPWCTCTFAHAGLGTVTPYARWTQPQPQGQRVTPRAARLSGKLGQFCGATLPVAPGAVSRITSARAVMANRGFCRPRTSAQLNASRNSALYDHPGLSQYLVNKSPPWDADKETPFRIPRVRQKHRNNYQQRSASLRGVLRTPQAHSPGGTAAPRSAARGTGSYPP